jgi:hypothetical protein
MIPFLEVLQQHFLHYYLPSPVHTTCYDCLIMLEYVFLLIIHSNGISGSIVFHEEGGGNEKLMTMIIMGTLEF